MMRQVTSSQNGYLTHVMNKSDLILAGMKALEHRRPRDVVLCGLITCRGRTLSCPFSSKNRLSVLCSLLRFYHV